MKPEDIERIKDLLPTSLGSAEIRESSDCCGGETPPPLMTAAKRGGAVSAAHPLAR